MCGYGCMHRIYTCMYVCMYVCIYVLISRPKATNGEHLEATQREDLLLFFEARRGGKAHQKFFLEQRKGLEHFLLLQNKEPLVLLLYLISILNSQVIHTESIQKCTEVVMLAHYSPLKALTAICHAWSPAEPTPPPRQPRRRQA